jgi:uncharacterized protein (DUF1778 family)
LVCSRPKAEVIDAIRSPRRRSRATSDSDKTLTDFVIDVALQKADAIVRKNEVITLTPAEWERFQAMLLDPPEPNRRLRRAFAEHARIVRHSA